MPVASATASTLSPVDSRSSWARRANMSSRHLGRHFRTVTGTTPLQWLLNQRIRRARSSTVSGWSSRSITQGSRSASGWSSRSGTGAVTNCAWPPARCGGTTRRRATVLANADPWSRRTRCRQRSIAAALPAEVSTVPLST
ncbi:helix-turn-helix domain-containing protein [Streptomyces sp. MS191]|uniref:helix-turn-helix domain-containing protein n=1 Tax=Streptomyces sp. ms191 TaxID=1827978 RepID=UPI002905E9EF|nr:helix-turn-helix domain-containing protein [Streptomyces sp. ms191]